MLGGVIFLACPMKFDPTNRTLFTDEGVFVKRLHCPLRMRWSQLRPQEMSQHRRCEECQHQVLDTAAMSDAEISAAVRADPETCLSISPRQANVSIIHWTEKAALLT